MLNYHFIETTQLEDPRQEWRAIQETMLREYLQTAHDVLEVSLLINIYFGTVMCTFKYIFTCVVIKVKQPLHRCSCAEFNHCVNDVDEPRFTEIKTDKGDQGGLVEFQRGSTRAAGSQFVRNHVISGHLVYVHSTPLASRARDNVD